jgi:N-alpha-acetyl-L-2,4-diaminobutyrate deacetylase
MRKNPISSTIPFDKNGVHHGFLKLPYSRDDSAWGSVMIPICVIKNGDGPTALLTGGNHGDEYEGPIALQNLALELAGELASEQGDKLDENNITGRIIIVPGFNYPAFQSGTRTSPIDKGNMNRSFPGAPDGTVTQKIADYFQRTLVPMADIILDFHSGGKTLDFIPFAAAHILDDKTQQAQCVAAMQAFNAPYSVMLLEIDNVGMYDTAVEDLGKTFVSTELGGGGTATAKSIAIAKKGAKNLLIHAGILKGELDIGPSVNLDMPDGDCFTISEHDGLIEPMVDLGQRVTKGDLVARIWPIDRTGIPPVDYRAHKTGILTSRHFPGLIKSGDCIAVIAVVVN